MEKPNLIIYGRVIALSQVQEIASKEAGKPSIKKQEIYLDCTRYDSMTGERYDNENKPVLEFGGDKVVNKIAGLGLQKGDVVCIRFAVQGTPYKDQQTGKNKVYTAIRCYDIDMVRKAGQQAAQPIQAAPAPSPAPQPQTQAPQTQQQIVNEQKKDDLPF